MTPPERPTGLRAGALNLALVVVIGIASAAPGYSLAAALGLITASSGTHTPGLLLLAFLPMACVAIAFDQLNRLEPDCGTSFAWVARAFGPTWGWFTGWSIIAADIVVMASLAQIAAQYSLAFVGTSAVTHPILGVILGLLWIAAMTWVCYRGISFSAHLQTALLWLEVAVLVVLAGRMALTAGPAHLSVDWTWFWPTGLTLALVAQALGVAIFLYWGWDTAVNVNAESDNPTTTPGRAAILSTLALLAIFVLTAAAALHWAGPAFLVEHQGDVLAALGSEVLGAPWDRILHVVVLTSAIAATQTTILPAARTALSMAQRQVLPAALGHVHPQHQIPDNATLWMGAVSAAWFLGLSCVTDVVVAASLQALNFLVAFYYGLSGLACAWLFRRTARGIQGWLVQIVLPLVGAGALLWLMVYLAVWPPEGESHRDVLPMALAAGFMALGVPVFLMVRRPDNVPQ